MPNISIKKSEVEIVNETVVIKNNQLVNDLIQNQPEVLALLNSNGAEDAKINDISIDDQGRVVINNQKLKQAVESMLSDFNIQENMLSGNWVCPSTTVNGSCTSPAPTTTPTPTPTLTPTPTP